MSNTRATFTGQPVGAYGRGSENWPIKAQTVTKETRIKECIQSIDMAVPFMEEKIETSVSDCAILAFIGYRLCNLRSRRKKIYGDSYCLFGEVLVTRFYYLIIKIRFDFQAAPTC